MRMTTICFMSFSCLPVVSQSSPGGFTWLSNGFVQLSHGYTSLMVKKKRNAELCGHFSNT